MSRTDDLRQRGARDRIGGGGGAPFVDWPRQPPAWVEGRVLRLWETKYGIAVTIKVQARSNGLQYKGKDEDGNPVNGSVEPSQEVNVGLNYAALRDSVTETDIGVAMHFAFESWGESKASGNHYRNFAVLELPDPASSDSPPVEPETVPGEHGPSNDDGLPF